MLHRIALAIALSATAAHADAPCAAPPCAPLRIETPPRPALSQTQRLFLEANPIMQEVPVKRIAGVTVPEPEGWHVLMVGLLGLWLVRRRIGR